MYSDGVGEGMISHVFQYELTQIRDALQKMSENGDKLFNLTFIIVTKKLNSRFFRKIISNGHTNYENPIPGTVIDNTVTRTDRYDFYLVSQSVRQGSVAPTMYNIIFDESGFR